MRRALVAAAAVTASLAALPTAAPADPPNHSDSAVTYAIFGDTPYGKAQNINFPNDIAELNAATPDLVIHLGDIKNGSSQCNTSTPDPVTGGDFESVKAGFDALQPPLVYTPGDNEWTDCHRANNGGYVPTERLSVIRRMFFPVPGQTLGQNPMPVSYQDDYVENVAWMQSSVEFGTIDLPGSNNDWLAWFDPTQGFNSADDPNPLRSLEQIAEVNDRTAGDLRWIDHIFNMAKAHRAEAVAIGVQADMWDPAFFGGPSSAADQSDHFTPIVNKLAERALTFGRPVLLLNGDSHKFKDDHPMADPTTAQNQIYGLEQGVPNIERVTTNGSTTACHEWVKLHVDPNASPILSVERVKFARQPWGPGDASLKNCPGAVQVF
jgi:hypothetical protein